MEITVITPLDAEDMEAVFQMLERMENDAAAIISSQNVLHDSYDDEDGSIWKEILKLEALPDAAFTKELDERLSFCYWKHNKLIESMNECEEKIKQERKKMEHIQALISLYKK